MARLQALTSFGDHMYRRVRSALVPRSTSKCGDQGGAPSL